MELVHTTRDTVYCLTCGVCPHGNVRGCIILRDTYSTLTQAYSPCTHDGKMSSYIHPMLFEFTLNFSIV